MSTQSLQIAFGSVNEGDDPKALPPGTMLRAENCAMDKGRRLVKRYGTSGLVKTLLAGGSITSGKRLLLRDKDTTIHDGTTAQAYVESLAKWQPIDRPTAWSASKRPLADSTQSVRMLDIAISGNLLVSVFETMLQNGLGTVSGTGTLTYVQVEDLETGAQILAPTQVFATVETNGIRVLVSGTTAHILTRVAAGINVRPLDLATMTLGSITALTTNAVTGTFSPFDAVIGTSAAGEVIYVVYELASGTDRTRIASFRTSNYAADQTEDYPGTTLVTASLYAGAVYVYLVYSYGTPLTRLVTATVDLVAVAGPTTVVSGGNRSHSVFVVEDDSTNVLVGKVTSDVTGATLSAPVFRTGLYSKTGHVHVAASARLTLGVSRANKPWRTNGRWYAAVTLQSIPFVAASADPVPNASVVVLEVSTVDNIVTVQDSPHAQAGTLENQTGWYQEPRMCVQPAIDSDGNVWVAAPARTREPASRAETMPTAWSVYKLEVGGRDAWRSATLGAGALMAGAVPCWNDGASIGPYGFACAPLIFDVVATAGGAMAVGTYSYVAVFAWRDANGVLHRSTPSPPKTGTTAGGNLSLTVGVTTASLSSKQRAVYATSSCPVLIELYRTTVGASSQHYRLTMEPVYQVLLNPPLAGTTTLLDTKADADIAGAAPAVPLSSRQQLYTDTGEMADVPPPAFVTVATHRGRLVGIGPDLRTVWFSKDSTQDTTIAPGFNEELTLAFASDKVALASLDERLVVFGEDTIDLVNGDGPDVTGANNNWSIQGIQTDVGCINAKSVVASPQGVMFQSARGLELLGRGLDIVWVGETMVDTLAAFPVITSAVLVAAETEIRFTCNADDGETGIVLVWNYLHKTWFTRVYTDAADTDDESVPFVDAALIDGVYTLLTAGGQVYQETSAHKLDDGTAWVNRDIVLAPISPGGTVSWNRVKDLTINGTSVTNHDLEVSFARDYATSYETTRTFEAGGLVTTIGPLEKCRVTVKNQKCQAIQVRIRDLTPTDPTSYPVSTGDGPILEALSLRVSVKGGPPLTASTEQK